MIHSNNHSHFLFVYFLSIEHLDLVTAEKVKRDIMPLKREVK